MAAEWGGRLAEGPWLGWRTADTCCADETLAVDVTLTDQSTPAVVARPQTSAPAARAGKLSRHRSVIVGQRRWQLQLEPTGTLLVATDQRMPALAFGLAC